MEAAEAPLPPGEAAEAPPDPLPSSKAPDFSKGAPGTFSEALTLTPFPSGAIPYTWEHSMPKDPTSTLHP